ncbi:MAG: Ppx/GppA family phosphatase [Thermodesulfobacteriota bacterium]
MTPSTRNASSLAAAVDVGANSIRLLVAGFAGGQLRVAAKKRYTPRLGRGVAATGVLAPEAMTEALAVLDRCRATLDGLGVERVRACGTSALRAAANRDRFLQAAAGRGWPVEVVSGEEEAALALAGALVGLPSLADLPVLVVDVGGGSTELAFRPHAGGGGQPVSLSLPLGALSLTEAFADPSAPGGLDGARMNRHLHSQLSPLMAQVLTAGQPAALVATGGTACALAALDRNLLYYDGRAIQGHALSREALDRLTTRLAALVVDDRLALPGLAARQGDILLAGTAILQDLLALVGLSALLVSDSGFLEGILLSCLGAGSEP